MTTTKTQYRSKKELANAIGGIGNPSKMPGRAWGISALICKTGSKLAKVKGSVCESCYALKNFYRMPSVKNAHDKRKAAIDGKDFVSDFVEYAKREGLPEYFRFLDSGDLQSVLMLQKFCQIASQLPHIKFWIPTREYRFVRSYILRGNSIPENVTIRFSDFMIDATEIQKSSLDRQAKKIGVQTSGVGTKEFTCPASKQSNECGDCRTCWNRNIPRVTYKQH
jgi:hypothetical protein